MKKKVLWLIGIVLIIGMVFLGCGGDDGGGGGGGGGGGSQTSNSITESRLLGNWTNSDGFNGGITITPNTYSMAITANKIEITETASSAIVFTYDITSITIETGYDDYFRFEGTWSGTKFDEVDISKLTEFYFWISPLVDKIYANFKYTKDEGGTSTPYYDFERP